jgi:hypothetical protein
VTHQIRNSADMLGFGALVARCDDQLAIERAVASKLRRFERAGRRGEGSSLGRLMLSAEKMRDMALVGLESMLEHESMLHGRPEGDAAQALLQRLLPDGAMAIITLRSSPLAERIAALVALSRGELRVQADKANATRSIELVESQSAAFQHFYDCLEVEQRVVWEELRALDDGANQCFVELVAHVSDIARGANQIDLREELLAPLVAQEREMRRCYRYRDAVSDVDPESGRVLGVAPTTHVAA